MFKYILLSFGLANLISGQTFDIPSGDVASIGSGAVDTATSLVGAIGDLLPEVVPLLVVGFIVSMVIMFFKRR